MSSIDIDWLRTHVGHEVKYMTYAAVQYRIRSAAGDFGNVAMQDSTLTRARALLDFIRSNARDRRSGHLDAFFVSPATEALIGVEKDFFGFVSRALSHIGVGRDSPAGRWPGVNEHADDRSEAVAKLVLTAIEKRLPKVRPDARRLLELMVRRAGKYLDDPSDTNFHAMDPANF